MGVALTGDTTTLEDFSVLARLRQHEEHFGDDAMPPHVAAFENVDIEIGAAENDYADRPVRLHGR